MSRSFDGFGEVANGPTDGRGEASTLDNASSAIELTHVKKAFGSFKVIEDCSIKLPMGGVLALVGANGAGKTTLFNLISGVLRCDTGTITLHGVRINHLSVRQISNMGLGRTFQNIRIFESMTVEENVLASAERRFLGFENRARIGAIVREAIGMMDLNGLERVRAGDLGYAEQKFLSIARVLARRPGVVLLDEPASGMDASSRERLSAAIKSIRMSGASVMLVEHNLGFVLDTATELAYLEYGVVRAQGDPRELMSRPDLVEAYFGG